MCASPRALPHAVLADRCVLSSSEMEWTRTAQWCDFPLQTGTQKTPRGPDAELNGCHSSHCGGKRLTLRLCSPQELVAVCLLSSSWNGRFTFGAGALVCDWGLCTHMHTHTGTIAVIHTCTSHKHCELLLAAVGYCGIFVHSRSSNQTWREIN